jgi:hypothetical protein
VIFQSITSAFRRQHRPSAATVACSSAGTAGRASFARRGGGFSQLAPQYEIIPQARINQININLLKIISKCKIEF